ncbi:MAG: hypothetical protein KGL18_05450 [Burkholderiales bacterium]|nr:hypothetical protein [Burkholderiales bacterium]MDE1926685.1 hypothetical protein [Burkholderiales bacterium]MDE2158853.1 hypothetical protein [Burkholderiales bacterium]MDE2502406.1 hypothetical protein [Burkholderiales bacterium]
MAFLLLKILALLLLAALAGAWLAHWWLMRRYQDVTVRYHQFASEWQSWRDSFERRLGERPAVDLDPLLQRLRGVEAAVTPLPSGLDRVQASVRAIALPVPREVDLQPLHARLAQVEQAVRAITIPAPREVDLGPLGRRMEALEAAIRSLSIPAPSPVPAPAPAPSAHVRAGSRNLLVSAVHGKPDDLQKIHGVADVMEQMMHDIGVYYFWQIAEWTPADIAHADAQLTAFHGRIERDDWVTQAARLALESDAARKPTLA